MEHTIFLEIMGDSPLLKVMDFLIVNDDFDYSMTDIANGSGVGYSTLKLLWPSFERNTLVINTRMVGKARMYKLDDANPIVKKMKEFYWTVATHENRKLLPEGEVYQVA